MISRQFYTLSDTHVRRVQLTGSAHRVLLHVPAVMLLLTISTQINVSVASGAVMTWNNLSRFCIPSYGAASSYPSEILVDGLGADAVVLDVDVRLRLGHLYIQDVDVLLVSPTGRKSLLMSDAGGTNSQVETNLLSECRLEYFGSGFILSDGAVPMPQNERLIEGSTYAPTDYEETAPRDVFVAPAPGGPYDASLSVFNGGYANGAWRLYVMDDTLQDAGLVDGWSLTITWIDPSSPGDTNGDGMVDLVDLNNVRNHFGDDDSPIGDTDGDVDVDIDDLNAVRNNFGVGTTGNVPEPPSCVLLTATALALAVCRRTNGTPNAKRKRPVHPCLFV